MTLHATARLSDLPTDRPTRVDAGEQSVILIRVGDQVSAYEADCPHAGAPLEDGTLCNGMLICPFHRAAFALDDGSLIEPPALTGLKRFATQVRDGQVWVEDQPEVRTPRQHSDARCFVVVGAGAAGSAAVATLIERGFGGRLVWIDQERKPAYDRTALSKFVIAGDMTPEDVPNLLEPRQLRGVRLERVHGKVKLMDVTRRRIVLDNGERYDYDHAILATGAKALRPELPGANLDGVHLLRTREDAAGIIDQAEPGKPVVIVGDGFIGLEAASALLGYGMQVHIVGRQAVPLVNVLGERIGRSIRQLHESKGITFHGPAEVERFEGQGRVEAVVLKDGTRLPCSLVVLGTGVKPATRFVQGVKLADDGGVPVDAELSAAEGLWAAGDLAVFPLGGDPMRIEHWRLAQQHGQLAAENALGEHRRFVDVPYFWTFQHKRRYEVLGHARHWDSLEVVGDPEDGDFIALQCRDDEVEAVIALGYSQAMGHLSQRMRHPLSRTEALTLIENCK